FNGLQTEGSSGRLDVIVNVLLTTKNNPIEFWHTQILAGLSLTAAPRRFSHRASATVTFTVTDAGAPVQGAKVSCLGKHATTNSQGHATLKCAAGGPVGRHPCTATMTAYFAGRTTIRVT